MNENEYIMKLTRGGKRKMIYTVTFNPSLDYIVGTEGFKLGNTNRTVSEMILPGGKGINVSTVLKNLGIENTALGFTAGFTGAEIRRRVEELGFRSEFIEINTGFSRINVKMKEFDGTEINGQGPVISRDAVEALMQKLDKLGEGDTLVLAGSIPSSMPDSIYSDIMARLRDRGVTFVVDATKDLLLNVLEYHPFLIKPNHHELGEIFGVTLKERGCHPVCPSASGERCEECACLHGREGSRPAGCRTAGAYAPRPGRKTGKRCRIRRFHGGRIYCRMDREKRL